MPIFGAKIRAVRGCASKLACGRRIDALESCEFAEDYRKISAFCRADVGIGPYRVSAIRATLQISNAKLTYCSHTNATFCKFSCTVTGGAYHSARRVTMYVRNN